MEMENKITIQRYIRLLKLNIILNRDIMVKKIKKIPDNL